MQYRLKMAGLKQSEIFADEAYEMIAELSLGIPRNINNLCFNALSLGFALREKTIGRDIMHEVAADLDLTNLVTHPGEISCPPDAMLDTIPRDAGQWAQPERPYMQPASAAASAPAASLHSGETVTPIEAKAYMQQVVQLLRNGPRIPN
jgi:hypothetical protein